MIVEIVKIYIRCDSCDACIDIPNHLNRTGARQYAKKHGWITIREPGGWKHQHLCPACAVAHQVSS